MNITCFKATPVDVDILVTHRIQFALELTGDQPTDKIDLVQKQLHHYFIEAMLNETCISVIAQSGEQVVGIGSMHIRTIPANFKNLSGKWGYIMNMYTVPAYRRQGICRKILDFLMEEGKKCGITAFELHATPTGAMVYQQAGFQIHTEPTYRKLI
jgi:predicted acetyltransferase